MRVRSWIYLAAGVCLVVVILFTTHDQLLVDYGDDDRYLLGKATPLITWILTLVTPFALFDFFSWLRRSYRNTSAFWWATVGVVASFIVCWYLSKEWRFVWLEGDIEISFDRDEFLEVVVGLWAASAAALIIWLILKPGTARVAPESTSGISGPG
jgi:hypothetical protein